MAGRGIVFRGGDRSSTRCTWRRANRVVTVKALIKKILEGCRTCEDEPLGEEGEITLKIYGLVPAGCLYRWRESVS